MLRTILLLALYVFLSTYGLYKIKASEFGFNLGFVVGFGSYLAGFIIWFLILKTNPLSVAFPVAAGLLIVATQFVGFTFLGESVTALKGVGVALIISGIVMVYANG